jgi:hypothetical protein
MPTDAKYPLTKEWPRVGQFLVSHSLVHNPSILA